MSFFALSRSLKLRFSHTDLESTCRAHDFSDVDLIDPASEAQQVEIKSSNGDVADAADGKMHLVGLVVTQTDVAFFRDATLIYKHGLPRPVTDCKGENLRIGEEGIPMLGEIAFFPREVSVTEMAEVMFSGFPLQVIATGKLPFVPDTTILDDLRAEQTAAFQENSDIMKNVASTMIIENSYIRSDILDSKTQSVSTEPVLSVPLSQECQISTKATFTGSGNPPPCNIIQDDLQLQSGALSGTTLKYYELFTPSLRGNMSGKPAGDATDVYRFDPKNKQWLNYNVSKFPSFCGQSVSFSLWFDRTNGQARN